MPPLQPLEKIPASEESGQFQILASAEIGGNKISETKSITQSLEVQSDSEITNDESGGCLIATATFGSELSPQVQQLRELRDKKVSTEQIQSLLDQLAYIPVITAHPTESKRRTIMNTLRRIFETNEQLNDKRLNKVERRQLIDELENQIQLLWKTDEVRTRRPSVKDEVGYGLTYFNDCLFEAVPRICAKLEGP